MSSIIILLYKWEIYSSPTIKSILASKLRFENVNLVIWNNGPRRFQSTNVETLTRMGFLVSIVETIENRALSSIYNQFIKEYSSNRYIILDHDSKLNDNYIINALNSDSSALSIPLIYSNGIVRGPKINNSISEVGAVISKNDRILTIGSGIVIGKEIAAIVENKYGNIFDEKFYLYGVDSSFFIRISNLLLSNRVNIIDGFEHSLSRLETETKAVKDFRLKERGYDLGLTLRFYPSLKYYKKFFKLLFKSFFYRSPLPIHHVFKSFLSGKHYRSLDEKNKKHC